jgi:AraC family transcriptional regulator, regulatory protein of adaptative response / methylated-DNA-[protein]-cysteine methyltransferase
MRARWPNARYTEDKSATAPYAKRIFDSAEWRPDSAVARGADRHQLRSESVGDAPGDSARAGDHLFGYRAQGLLRKAARAVGAAVGKNPISFVVPCHRVLGKNGALTGYHWGLTRKKAMLGWEAGKIAG